MCNERASTVIHVQRQRVQTVTHTEPKATYAPYRYITYNNVQASVAIVVYTSILCQVHWHNMHAGHGCTYNGTLIRLRVPTKHAWFA